MTRSRDDFSRPVVRKLAERVCYHCSHPKCRKQTLGPSANPNESINLGKAAHITAAAQGGPRYDPKLTPAQRTSIENGIWLCGIHADLIDKKTDEAVYPVAMLRDWKLRAEQRAALEAFTNQGGSTPRVVLELSNEDHEFLRTLALPPEDTADSITLRLKQAASKDIQAFVDSTPTAGHAISLNLTLVDEDAPVDLAGLARGISAIDIVALVSPPGTGKTTTLIQLAEAIHNASDRIAVYLPLGEWEGTSESWFEHLIRHNAFRAFKPEHFMQLAYVGRLVLLLDGWNELSPDASRQALKLLSALQRDFPQVGVVIGTRQQAYPVDWKQVRIESLSEVQQLDIAVKLRGAEGEKLLEQAWQTPGLRELVAIPLYLNALLVGVQGATLPDTKDALLRNFVRQHESAPDKALILRTRLSDVHAQILTELASGGNSIGTTTLTEEQARPAVASAVSRLQFLGQLAATLQPATVIDALVDSHLLTRTAAGNVSFQHQQFQEWYASFHVERLMLTAATDESDRRALREMVLDRVPWEESIFFACERLSRRDQAGITVTARAITETLGVDPMLAAEMIRRSADDVWKRVQGSVTEFAGKWHHPGHPDRAMRFMMMTGRLEFAQFVWPLLEHSDDQVYRHAVRLAEPFRPSVLGPDAERRLAALTDPHRGNVLAEIVHQGGIDGVELATAVTKIEKHPQIVAEVLEALEFRGAARHVTDILARAGTEVWDAIVDRGLIRELHDDEQQKRLAAMRRERFDREADPVKQSRLLLHSRVQVADPVARVRQVLTSENLEAQPDKGRAFVQEVATRFPAVAAEAIVERLQAGRDVPRGVEDILETVPVVDEGRIADLALEPSGNKPRAYAVRRLIGPRTVGKLIDAFVALESKLLIAKQAGKPYDKAASDEYFAYRDAITESRESSFVAALLERAETKVPCTVSALADLLHLHGRRTDHAAMVLTPEVRARVVANLLGWGEALLADPNATRHHAANVVMAMARVPDPAFVPLIDRMLRRDMAEAERELQELKKGRQTPVRMSYDNWYCATLAAIGDAQVSTLMTKYLADLRFGLEAARVLLDIWNRDHPSANDRRLHLWNDYSEVRSRREETAADPPVANESTEAIWSVVRQFGKPSESPERQRHAIELACIAMRMPFGVNPPELPALLSLPVPFSTKRGLFVAAAMSRVVLSAAALSEAIRDLLRDAQTQHWRLDENGGELMTWIELFAFSDQPMTVLASLDSLSPDYRVPYRLRRLLGALGQSPHPDSVKVLKTLAERDPRIIENDDWWSALMRLGSVEAAHVALDVLCSGTPGSQKQGASISFADRLAAFATAHPEFKRELLRHYSEPATCKASDIVEAALLAVADQETVLSVIGGMANRGEKFDFRLARALRDLAIGEKPSEQMRNAVELFSVPLTEFRKQLFAFLSDQKQSVLAQRCLEKIDELRDEYGRIKDEPRHPDITSGKPWPILNGSGALSGT